MAPWLSVCLSARPPVATISGLSFLFLAFRFLSIRFDLTRSQLTANTSSSRSCWIYSIRMSSCRKGTSPEPSVWYTYSGRSGDPTGPAAHQNNNPLLRKPPSWESRTRAAAVCFCTHFSQCQGWQDFESNSIFWAWRLGNFIGVSKMQATRNRIPARNTTS